MSVSVSLYDEILKNEISTDVSSVMTVYLKYISFIKKQMLISAKNQLHEKGLDVFSLLDLATGVGNDLYKWSQLTFNNVIGIDINEEYIKEAYNRLETFRKQNYKNFYVPNVQYFIGSMTDSNFISEKIMEVTNNKDINLITNNFSLNFLNENQLNSFFECISKNLRPNGLFIGTAVDGDSINNIFKDRDELNLKMYHLKKCHRGSDQFFENRYQFKLNEARFFNNKYLEEYIITKELLIKLPHYCHIALSCTTQ